MPQGQHIDLIIKAKIMAELSAGKSVLELSRLYSVHRGTIQTWKKKTKTRVGELQPFIQSSIRDKIVAKLVDSGVDAQLPGVLMAALNAVRDVIVPSNQKDPITGEKEPGMIAPDQPDYMTRMKAVEHLRKILGLDAPTKGELAVTATYQGPNLSGATEQEIEQLETIMRNIEARRGAIPTEVVGIE